MSRQVTQSLREPQPQTDTSSQVKPVRVKVCLVLSLSLCLFGLTALMATISMGNWISGVKVACTTAGIAIGLVIVTNRFMTEYGLRLEEQLRKFK